MVTPTIHYRGPAYPPGHATSTGERPVVSLGLGCYLFDEAGNRYLDGSSGAIVANLGHGVPEIATAVEQQLARVAYVHRSQFDNAPARELARRLIGLAPRDHDTVLFTNSGSLRARLSTAIPDPASFTVMPYYYDRSIAWLARTLGAGEDPQICEFFRQGGAEALNTRNKVRTGRFPRVLDALARAGVLYGLGRRAGTIVLTEDTEWTGTIEYMVAAPTAPEAHELERVTLAVLAQTVEP